MTELQKLEMLYEGKAKIVYRSSREDAYIVSYKDDATAFNGEKRGTIGNKGIVNNKVSTLLFKLLEELGVETHFLEVINDREMLVKAVKIIPLEVIVRNIAAGSLSKRLGVAEGEVMKSTIVELCYKNDVLGDPLINEDHALALGLATMEELSEIRQQALKINEILKSYLYEKNLLLVDFKLEFGSYKERLILADEISPDTCRLWDIKTKTKLDKDRFRRDLGEVEEAYQEVLKRLSK